MKAYLLPLATTLGAVGSFAAMLTTQAAQPCCTNPEMTWQIQQMEHQSRLREWSQGLGIDLSAAGTTITKAETGSTVVAKPEEAAGTVKADTRADRVVRHKHDGKHD
jgi:hypothetical protein